MAKERRRDGDGKTSLSPRYITAGFFSAFALILYFFWAFPYRAALGYREQLQLFQTTGSYFENLACRPGGMAAYAGEFLTQFFNNYWIGAAVITALMLLCMLVCYALNKRFAPTAPKRTNLALAVMLLVAIWLFLGNPDVTMTFITALLTALAATYLFIAIYDRCTTSAAVKTAASFALMLAHTALLYWLAGPVVIIFSLLTIVYICKSGKILIAVKAIYAIVALAWLAANVWIWSSSLPYPLSYQLIGIGYIMTPDTLDAWQVIVEALCVVTPIVAALIAGVSQKIALPVVVGIELAAFIILYGRAYDATAYKLINYDYMVRANDWDGILEYSDAHNPDLPLSVSATNLALGMTGQLDSRAFEYYQRGVEGLFPPFTKETLSSWTTGEILFQLGMANSAQRFYFEGMEAIPNYNKSSRAVKRLAETAIIRGEYALAEKYLRMLENTLFYKKWAQRNLELVRNPGEIDNHPLYGTIRKRMIDEDYLFSEGELDKTLGQLFLKDPGNNPAKQYLIVYPLLQRDLNKFAQYMGVVTEADSRYNPLLAQQALAFISMKNGQPIPQGGVSPAVEQSLRSFAQAWLSKNQSQIDPFRRSLYYYLLSDN